MNEKILIIEDDSRLAELVSGYLNRQGCQASTHGRGDSAEKMIAE